MYYADGDLEHYFMLLVRYTSLVVEDIPRHPEAKLPQYKADLRKLYLTVPDVMKKMEELKPILIRSHEEWQKAHAVRAESSKTFGADSFTGARVYSSHSTGRVPSSSTRTRALAPQNHGDIPVKLFNKEQRRRDDARQSGRELSQRGWSEADRKYNDLEMQRQMEDSRRRMGRSQNDMASGSSRKLTKSRSPERPSSSGTSGVRYSYPSIKHSSGIAYDSNALIGDRSYARNAAPARPAKQPMFYDIAAPAPAPKIPNDNVPRDPTPDDEVLDYTFKPAAYLENGTPLRCLFLPQKLRSEFLKIAHPNTRKSIETCGILCGTIVQNAVFISRLVIPEQEGTSDTCDMTNEGALFDYCESHDMMVFGWIHTHPTQSCFMSSRDLHTHGGFQVMMPEAVAIVCAPSRENR